MVYLIQHKAPSHLGLFYVNPCHYVLPIIWRTLWTLIFILVMHKSSVPTSQKQPRLPCKDQEI